MILAISGKINSGKDLTGQIIQYLVAYHEAGYTTSLSEVDFKSFIKNNHNERSNWKVVKFAAKLKQIVSLLTGISVEDLEKQEVKNSLLPSEWQVKLTEGFFRENGSYGKSKRTYRWLLQTIGTNALRDVIHENVHINGLFVDYKCLECDEVSPKDGIEKHTLPNLLVTDLRFPNELKAIEDRGGITIRVNRDLSCIVCKDTKADRRGKPCTKITCPNGRPQHESETALDSVTFNYTINNDGTIEDLIEKVKEILIKEQMI